MTLAFAFEPASLRAPLLAWYRRARRPLPWRVLWERHRDPYHVWVSEIMLQQTVVKAVVPVYERFLGAFPSVFALADADESAVRRAVRGLGYYRRFGNLHAAARDLTREACVWPTTYAGWRELPGVGDYTAAAVCSIAFDVPVAVVDGNVERVFARLLDLRRSAAAPGVKSAFKALATAFLAPTAPGDFNQALMELGQTVCTVQAPACDACPLAPGCLAKARGTQALSPTPKRRADTVDVAMRLVIIESPEGGIGLVRRPAEARFLKQTLGFVTGLGAEGSVRIDGGETALPASTAPPLGIVRHSITHHRIAARVESWSGAPLAGLPPTRWIEAAAVEAELVSNLDRKAWRLFQHVRESRSPRRP